MKTGLFATLRSFFLFRDKSGEGRTRTGRGVIRHQMAGQAKARPAAHSPGAAISPLQVSRSTLLAHLFGQEVLHHPEFRIASLGTCENQLLSVT